MCPLMMMMMAFRPRFYTLKQVMCECVCSTIWNPSGFMFVFFLYIRAADATASAADPLEMHMKCVIKIRARDADAMMMISRRRAATPFCVSRPIARAARVLQPHDARARRI